jgi:DNA-binding response OmpR family regulator
MTGPFSILVTDRNRHVRDLLKRELIAEGYQVSVAANRNQLLEVLEHPERLDLIILDPDLAGTDRADNAASWRKIMHAERRPPILLHTFWNGDLLDAGEVLDHACALVEKGGDLEPLKVMIRRVLKQLYPTREAG